MSLVAGGIALAVIHDVAVGLLTSGFLAVGRRASHEAFRSKDTRSAPNARLYEILQGEVVVEELSISTLAGLASSRFPVSQIQRILDDRAVHATVQQLVCAVLVDARNEKFERIENSFKLSIAIAMRVETQEVDEFAGGLFDLLEQSARARFDSLPLEPREPIAEAIAHLVLIQATVDSVEQSFQSLTTFSSVSAQTDLDNWINLYRVQCAGFHGVITPPDFRERNPVALDKIYVPGQIQTARRQQMHLPPISLYDLMPNLDRDVLLGDPGGGKSTATQALTHKFARDPNGPLPFVVVLREFAPKSSELSVAEFIELQLKSRYQAEAPSGAVEAILNSGRSIVLFDGLDELLDSSLRLEVAKKVEMFSSRYPLSKVFVTSRKVGYKEAKLDQDVFAVHELAGYSDEDVRTYVEKWFGLQGAQTDESVVPPIESFLHESDSISDLRSNPLLLALLCIIYRGQGYLPKNRIGIYEECSKLLFQSWDRSRGIVFDFTFESHIEDALKYLAYWMFNSSDSDDGVLESRLTRELTAFFQERAFETGNEAETAAKDFIEFCRGRAWVLSEAGTTPEGDSLFKFTHRTFMEFFAASQLTRLAPEPKRLARLLLPKIARGEWDTVGQLAIHLINRSADRGAEVALEQMLRSSANRTVQYRSNVCSFIANCLDYLAIAPGLVRKAVTQSLELMVESYIENPTAPQVNGAWAKLAYVENRTDDTIDDEITQWLRTAISSGDANRVTSALMIVDRIGWVSLLSSSASNFEREAHWHALGTDLLREFQALILDENQDFSWIADEFYFRKIISLEELRDCISLEGDLPLDFLFRYRAHPTEQGVGSYQGPPMAWSMINWMVNILPLNDSGPGRHGRRIAIDMTEDIGRLLSPLPNVPLVRTSQATISAPLVYGHVSDSRSDSWKDELSSQTFRTLMILACCYVEIAEPGSWKVPREPERLVATFLNSLDQVRQRTEGFPEGLLQDSEDTDDALRSVMEQWANKTKSFVVIDSNSISDRPGAEDSEM